MSTEGASELIPPPPLADLAEVVLDQMHTDCNCQVCLENTAKSIAERICDEFEVRRRVPA